MVDVSTLNQLPSPADTDNLVAARGSSPYVLNLGNLLNYFKANSGKITWDMVNKSGISITWAMLDKTGFAITPLMINLSAAGNLSSPADNDFIVVHRGATTAHMSITDFINYISRNRIYDFRAYDGAGAEIMDWPNPHITMRRYDNFNQMVMLAFGYRGDTPYTPGNELWNFMINGNSAGKTVSDNFTDMFIRGPGELYVSPYSCFTHDSDNNKTLGKASNRWSQVYAGNGAINTSDEREKKWRGALTEKELEAAKRIIGEIGGYQWLSSIKEKGGKARMHFGVRAQKIFAIMAECGLDPNSYGFCCYDEWEAKEPPALPAKATRKQKAAAKKAPQWPAGNRYGVRPDQLALFLIAAQEQRLQRLEKLLDSQV